MAVLNCPGCNKPLEFPTDIGNYSCPFCKTEIVLTKKTAKPETVILAMIVGILLFAFVPVIGWIVGPIIFLMAVFAPMKR